MMRHRVAGHLGWSLAQLERDMTAAEFMEWCAYYTIEPWGEERADLRAAIVAATVANGNRGKKQKPYKVEDFMPKFGPDAGRKKMSDAQIENVFVAIAALAGGMRKRGGKK